MLVLERVFSSTAFDDDGAVQVVLAVFRGKTSRDDNRAGGNSAAEDFTGGAVVNLRALSDENTH